MDARLVVVPHTDHGHLAGTPEVQEDGVVTTRCERGQPKMHVVLCTIDAVSQVVNDTWVFAIRRENVDVWRISPDVGGSERLSTGAEHLQAVEAHVVAIAPGGQDVDDQPLTLWQNWDFKLVLPLHGWIIVRDFAQSPLSSQGGKGAPRCHGGVGRDCGGKKALLLDEVIEDVTFKGHVGDASTLALVELNEGVPGLPEGVLLLAVQLGPRRTLPPVGDHQRQWLLWKIHKQLLLGKEICLSIYYQTLNTRKVLIG